MDPTTVRMLKATAEAEAAQAAELAQMQLMVNAAGLALANLPAFEHVELGGRIVAATIQDEVARFQIRGVGSTRAYIVTIPGDYLRQVVEQLDAAKAETEAVADGAGEASPIAAKPESEDA
jgi:hypothetical protein